MADRAGEAGDKMERRKFAIMQKYSPFLGASCSILLFENARGTRTVSEQSVRRENGARNFLSRWFSPFNFSFVLVQFIRVPYEFCTMWNLPHSHTLFVPHFFSFTIISTDWNFHACSAWNLHARKTLMGLFSHILFVKFHYGHICDQSSKRVVYGLN